MNEPTNDNDIDAMLHLLQDPHPSRHSTALRLLVAERDALKEENNALRSRCKVQQDEVLDRVFEMDALRKRVAELESQEFTLPHEPFRNPDEDLRARLVCAALAGLMAQPAHGSRESWANIAVSFADATLDAMRKGEA